MKNQSFFRQLGWVLVATTASGLCNASVHFFARVLGKEEYGLLQLFLQALLPQLAIPALGLQVAFVHLSASAVTPEQERNVSAAMRRVSLLLAGLWVIGAVLVAVFQSQLLATFRLGTPQALTILMATVLCALLLPVFSGVVQGRQDFLWFGWVTLLGGLGRLAGVALMIALLGPTALNAMLGVLLGQLISLAVAVWRSQPTWQRSPGSFEGAAFLRRITPLTLALGAITVFQTEDIKAAREALTGASARLYDLYSAAGGVARTVLYLAAPMISVMFPRIVREAAQSEKSTVLAQACGVSLLVCGGAALGATLFPTLPFRIVQGGGFLDAAPYLPPMAWSLLPLMLTTVLLNNLLARSRYGVVGPLVLLAAAYWWALRNFNSSPGLLIATLGAGATSVFVLTALFTWGESRTLPARRKSD